MIESLRPGLFRLLYTSFSLKSQLDFDVREMITTLESIFGYGQWPFNKVTRRTRVAYVEVLCREVGSWRSTDSDQMRSTIVLGSSIFLGLACDMWMHTSRAPAAGRRVGSVQVLIC